MNNAMRREITAKECDRRTAYGLMMLEQVAVDKAWKGQGHKKCGCGGIELPALGCNLTGAVLKQQAQTTDYKVKNHQLNQSPPTRFGFGKCDKKKQVFSDEWQIRTQHRDKNNQPHRHRLSHQFLPMNLPVDSECLRYDKSAAQCFDDGVSTQGHQTTGENTQYQNQCAIDGQHGAHIRRGRNGARGNRLIKVHDFDHT